MLKEVKTREIGECDLGISPDERIIGTYLHELKNKDTNLMFLSNDKGARILARNADLPVANV